MAFAIFKRQASEVNMSIEYPFLNINIIFFALLFSFHGPILQHNKLKHIVSPLRKKQRWKTI